MFPHRKMPMRRAIWKARLLLDSASEIERMPLTSSKWAILPAMASSALMRTVTPQA